MYETYADMAPGRWIHMKISVVGNQARLYLDNNEWPALVVNDLKLGPQIILAVSAFGSNPGQLRISGT